MVSCLSYRCEFGVLNTCYGEGDLELYEGDPGLTIEGWQSVPRISLRETTLKNNPKNDFFASRCQCTTKCTTASCSCKKRGVPQARSQGGSGGSNEPPFFCRNPVNAAC